MNGERESRKSIQSAQLGDDDDGDDDDDDMPKRERVGGLNTCVHV